MKFTDWFLKQLCRHTNEATGWSTFVLHETVPFRTKAVICARCQLRIEVSEEMWRRWLQETRHTVTP